MDRDALETELAERSDSDPAVVTVISRQARDLADSGQFDADFDAELTARDVVENLADAPDEYTLVERWNWWIGALDLSHGGYARFDVRPDIEAAER